MSKNETPKWEIERTERYWYQASRRGKTYVEITYWYNPYTLERKETERSADIDSGNEHNLPTWAKGIREHNPALDYN